MDKTLIIIPGWGGDKSTWQQAQTLFSKHIETICIELPCFGDVPCPKDVWGVKEYANFVEQSIQALNKKNIVILGHSFGGQVATYLVAKNKRNESKFSSKMTYAIVYGNTSRSTYESSHFRVCSLF